MSPPQPAATRNLPQPVSQSRQLRLNKPPQFTGVCV